MTSTPAGAGANGHCRQCHLDLIGKGACYCDTDGTFLCPVCLGVAERDQPRHCAACGKYLPEEPGVNPRRVEFGGKLVCARCYIAFLRDANAEQKAAAVQEAAERAVTAVLARIDATVDAVLGHTLGAIVGNGTRQSRSDDRALVRSALDIGRLKEFERKRLLDDGRMLDSDSLQS